MELMFIFNKVSRLLRNWWILKTTKNPLGLWLDDLRSPPDGWLHAATAKEAIKYLSTFEIETVSLDHDLGPASAGTGYDVACWLEANPENLPFRASCHSQNPVGARRIRAALASAKRRKEGYESDYNYRSMFKSL